MGSSQLLTGVVDAGARPPGVPPEHPPAQSCPAGRQAGRRPGRAALRTSLPGSPKRCAALGRPNSSAQRGGAAPAAPLLARKPLCGRSYFLCWQSWFTGRQGPWQAGSRQGGVGGRGPAVVHLWAVAPAPVVAPAAVPVANSDANAEAWAGIELLWRSDGGWWSVRPPAL